MPCNHSTVNVPTPVPVFVDSTTICTSVVPTLSQFAIYVREVPGVIDFGPSVPDPVTAFAAVNAVAKALDPIPKSADAPDQTVVTISVMRKICDCAGTTIGQTNCPAVPLLVA